MRAAALGLAGMLAAAGCERGPRIEVDWVGADTGRAVLRATATRCGSGPVELTAISGDTGIALVIHGGTPLASGAYPVSGPGEAASAPPAAALAARWLDSIEVHAYRSVEGRLELRVGPQLGGEFSARAERWGGGTGEVRLEGEIHGVPIGPCAAADSATAG